MSLSRASPRVDAVILVYVAPPGTSTLAVTPLPSSSCAMAATSASCPALEGPYGVPPLRHIVSMLVVTLMMRPQPWPCRCPTTALDMKKAPLRLTAITRLQTVGETSQKLVDEAASMNSAERGLMPALLIRICSPPSS